MAQKVDVQLIDDLDGGPADVTTKFGLEGTDYEIDLSKAHDLELRATLAKYVDSARIKTGGQRTRSRSTSRQSSATVRTWLREHGYEVTNRGRVPGDLVQKYLDREPALMPARTEIEMQPPAPTAGLMPAQNDAVPFSGAPPIISTQGTPPALSLVQPAIKKRGPRKTAAEKAAEKAAEGEAPQAL